MDGARRAAREYRDIFEPGSFFLEVQSNGMARAGRRQREARRALARRGHPARRHRRRALREPRGRQGPRGADVHRLGQDARGREAAQARHRRALHHRAGRDGRRPPATSGRPSTTPCASPRCATSSCKLGKSFLPTFELPEGMSEDGLHPEALAGRASTGASARSTASTRTTATPTAHRLELELGVIEKMGFTRLLPHRPGLHQLGEGARRPGRPGPRLGRRLHRGLVAAHHRPRPAPLEPALRALPEPRARLDARLRRRLLPEPARRGDPVRPRQVRPGQRRADHHLRLAQGALGDPRRGPRDGAALRRGRPDREAGPGPGAGQDAAAQGAGLRHREGAGRAAPQGALPEAGRDLAVGGRARASSSRSPPRTCSTWPCRSRG